MKFEDTEDKLSGIDLWKVKVDKKKCFFGATLKVLSSVHELIQAFL